MANGAVSAPSDKNLITSDVTTNDASTSKHGFMKKLSGSSTDVFKGDGTFGSAPAPSGLGWALKNYTAVSATSVSVSSLDLSTDLKYKIVLTCSGNNSQANLQMKINGSSAANYNYATAQVYFNGAGSGSNYGTSGDSAWGLTATAANTYEAEVDLAKLVTNSVTQILANWRLGGMGIDANSAYLVGVQGSGVNSAQTNVTSITFQLGGAPSCDWKVWVYQLKTS
jgi:hypothetical protein